jgi:hypothetical protein
MCRARWWEIPSDPAIFLRRSVCPQFSPKRQVFEFSSGNTFTTLSKCLIQNDIRAKSA